MCSSHSLLGLWPPASSVCLLDGDGVLDGSAAPGSWLTVTDLQPYTNYSFWIRGCNTQGCVASLQISVTTPPAGKTSPWMTTVKTVSELGVSCIRSVCNQAKKTFPTVKKNTGKNGIFIKQEFTKVSEFECFQAATYTHSKTDLKTGVWLL